MMPNSPIGPDVLRLLSLCDLFSNLDASVLEPSELEALLSEVSIVNLRRGEVLLKQGDPPDCMYTVIKGRLHVYIEGPDGEHNLVGELRSGETVGELGLIDGSARMATVIAIRDSELMKISEGGFRRLVRSNSESLVRIARAEAERMRTMGHNRAPALAMRTIAVIGAGRESEFERFTAELCAGLAEVGSVLHLNKPHFEQLFGRPFDATEGIGSWLGELENAYRFVVCEAEPEPTAWTVHSVREADRILAVGKASGHPELSATETVVFEQFQPGRMPSIELVLLHESARGFFPGVSKWLASRSVLRHHHVRSGVAGDVRRVARLLSGSAIGLALGGGGARGFAHIGVLQALDEADIPIDLVGGVSMGSIISALYAVGNDSQDIIRVFKQEWKGKLSSDVTIPLVALTTGRRLRRALRSVFGEIKIEELGLNYFCTSCNLSKGEMVIHRTGSVADALYASSAIPGILPPHLFAGELFIDGGILNNQPGDVLKKLCGGSIIVSNVSPRSQDAVDPGLVEMPSPWRILRSRWNPFERSIKVPTISETIMRSMTIASESKSREVEQMADFYLRPPVEEFRLEDFSRIQDLTEVGFKHTVDQIRLWKENGRLLPRMMATVA